MTHPPNPPSRPRSRRLLIIDDDPRFLRALEAMLSHLGHEVTRARSSQEARELLQRPDYDLILSDLTLFDRDPRPFLRAAQERAAPIPVIFITATEDATLLRRAHSGGAVACLRKPVGLRELQAWIDSGTRGTGPTQESD